MNRQNPLLRFKGHHSDVAAANDLPVSSIADKGLNAENYAKQLEQDQATLKLIDHDDIAGKIALKKQLVKNYDKAINGFLAGSASNLTVIVELMIWLFDTEDIERALKVAFRLIEMNRPMPDRFKSSMKTFVCDYTYDWASKQLKLNQSALPYIEELADAVYGESWELSEAVSSKVFAMLAKHKKLGGDWAGVIEACKKAEKLNPTGHGTKTLRTEAESKL